MTINWFSPIPPARSSIALDTAAVLPVLSQRATIVVWTHEPIRPSALEQYAKVRRYDLSAMPWAEINAADITIYHLGNQPNYHGPIWQVSRRHPGIVFLHDLNLQHFFAVLVSESLISGAEYLQMMEFHHPGVGRELGEGFLAGTKQADEIYRECPLTGAGIENALSVAVHTREGYSQLANFTDLPVAYVPLFAPPDTPSPVVEKDFRAGTSTSPEDPYRIIIFGFLSPNRRLESFMEALHQFPQRHRFRLDIYGTLADEKSIRRMVDVLGLNRLVTVHGFVSDRELNEALERSHLAVNLRNPTMGEASASQLRIWRHGLPSLVTDIGWYATLPKDTVATVRRDAELEDIQAHLAAFLTTPERYRALGQNGRNYVNENHTVEAYVNELMQLVHTTTEGWPREAASWMSGRVGDLMRPWFADRAARILLPRLAEAIGSLCGQRVSGR